MSDTDTDTAASADRRTLPLSGGGELTLSWAAVTHRGVRRDQNQDAVLADFPLFIVADGMGGHLGGEIASASTIDRLGAVVRDGKVSVKTIERALAKAVKDILSHPQATDDGTGTTVTGMFLDQSGAEPTWVTLNIGDSRVYLLRDDSLVQVTTDHSVVQELVAAGRLSPEEAENHPYGNVITRAVGPSESVQPDYVRLDVVDGDRFVICSDGLTKELTDYGIRHFLAENRDPKAAVEAMLAAALDNGGRDNITVIVLNVERTGHRAGDAEADTDTAARRGPRDDGSSTEPILAR
ncbi:protein phosphatase 2C domain-containing protein [Microbacterium limosum]|uniref:Protein phosphatase 2C domain-containing protein n=1 Tax=Microbacterium limosum TaxID=3079935 RepID=A0AAU0ME24_9MICO|nr:protein phosphatase 2C domain-containing protein [Microbacterium sp. Y20]WOQ68691.1 protein phosphatase 2C domain-containing protein [Microbacterium sp. Y20]